MKYSSKHIIKNWKLKEVIDQIEIVHEDSIKYRDERLKESEIPLVNNLTGIDRSETIIDWSNLEKNYSFNFDNAGEEEIIKNYLEDSELKEVENIIILYGWKEPAVRLPTKLFIFDWEGFIRSTQWETLIFSEDLTHLIEITRDYYMYSNFPIQTPTLC